MNSLHFIHLEPHESDLSRGDIISFLGDGQTGDVVTMAVEEFLLVSVYCLDEDSAAQGIDQVLLVRVAFETVGNVS